jgi:hypothetical protein
MRHRNAVKNWMRKRNVSHIEGHGAVTTLLGAGQYKMERRSEQICKSLYA